MTYKLILILAGVFALGLAVTQVRMPAKTQNVQHVQAHNNDVKRQKENIATARQQVASTPDSAEAHFALGEAYRNAEGPDAERALESYKRAILLKPDYAEAYKGLAWAYGTLNQHEQQINALEQAVRLNPNDAEAYCKLGDAYNTFDIGRRVPPFPTSGEVKMAVDRHEKKVELAVGAYERAIKIKPDFAEAYKGMGSAYLSLHRHTEAIAAYKRGIEHAPNNPLLRTGLGYVYLDLNNYEEALEQHKAAMRLIEDVEQPGIKSVYEIDAGLLFSRIQEKIQDKQRR